MHIVLLRHAESEKNKLLHDEKYSMLHTASEDSKLTETGVSQAISCTQILSNLGNKNATFWCSTLLRTAQTLEYAGVNMKNVTFKPILNEWRRNGVETLSEAIHRRVNMLMKELRELRNIEYIVIAGHSVFFSLLISSIFDNDKIIVEFPNCSLSSLCLENDIFSIYNIGDVSHIPEKIRTGVHKPW